MKKEGRSDERNFRRVWLGTGILASRRGPFRRLDPFDPGDLDMKSLLQSYGGIIIGVAGTAAIIGLIFFAKPELAHFLENWCSRFL